MKLIVALMLLWQSAESLVKNLEPRNIGPAIMGGRIDDFAVVEVNPEIIYAGAATGGVWKSTNAGTTWTPVFDDYGTTSIGDIAIAPSNPNIVWAGTGEANNRQSSSWGNGVYKSVDAGKTWQRMGLEDSHHIGRIVIDPKNPDIVYAAALGHLWGPNKERGLFKTVDGGKTWTNTKFINDDTGFADVVMDPSNSNVLYAASYQRRRTPWGFNGGGPGGALYKTTDAGKSWTQLTNGLPSTGNVGRIGIDIYRKNPSVVYVCFEHKEGGIFRSDDAGKTWKKVNSLSPRPLYFSQIRIDPQDDNRIYMLGNSLFVSDDAGKTFRSDGARNVHVDHHAMWIDPNNPRSLILGNDGGVWFSRDRSRTWVRINNIPLGQFYGIAFDMRDPYSVYGGLQDNAVWGGPNATRHRVGPLNDDWIQIGGGDGMLTAVDPADYRNVYVETQDGRLIRFDPDAGELKSIRPFQPAAPGGGGTEGEGGAGPGSAGPGSSNANAPPAAVRFNWTTPLVISPHNPGTIYLAGNKLWRSLDRGDHWQAISPDLTKQIDRNKIPIMGLTPGDTMLGRNDGVSAYGTATSMAESPLQPGLYLVGTDDGNVQISRDGGSNWANIASKFPVPENTWVSKVDFSRFDARRMYVAFDGHRSDDFNPYIFTSNDGGETWQPIARGLRAPVRTLKEDLRNPNLLFAGTESGLWISADRGGSWSAAKNGMADVPVYDIQIHPRTRELLLGTHGRSIYAMNIAPLEDLTEEVLSTRAHLFAPVSTTTFNRLEHRDFIGQSTYVGANPPYGANLDYYLREPASNLKITIEDRDGQQVQELKGSSAAGLNRVRWDLRYTAPPEVPRQQRQEGVDPSDPRPAESSFARVAGDTGGGGDPTGGEAGAPPAPATGPMVLPGEYVVKLSADGIERRALLTVKGDPRTSISDEDRRKQSEVIMEVYRLQKEANPISAAASELNTQMSATTKALGAIKDLAPEIKKASDDTARQIRDVQGRISRALGQLGGVSGEVARSTTAPTEAQIMQLRSGVEALKQALPQFKEVESKVVPEFNQKLDAASIPTSVPRLH